MKLLLISLAVLALIAVPCTDSHADRFPGVYEIVSWTATFDIGMTLTSAMLERLSGKAIISDSHYVLAGVGEYREGPITYNHEAGTYTVAGNQVTFNNDIDGTVETATFEIDDPYVYLTFRDYDSTYGSYTEVDTYRRIGDVYSQADIDTAVAAATSGLYTQTQLNQAVQAAIAGLYTQEQLDQAVAMAKEGMYTQAELETAVQNAVSTLYTEAEVNAAVAAATSSMFTEAQLNEEVSEAVQAAVAAATASMFTQAQLDEEVQEAVQTAVTAATSSMFTEAQLNEEVRDGVQAVEAEKDSVIDSLYGMKTDGVFDVGDVIFGLQILTGER